MTHETQAMEKTVVFYLILSSCAISLTRTAPIGGADLGEIDYNTLMSNFKDFFMYLPVMFSTFRDSMSGFPKLAESLKILTSPYYESPYNDDEDCKCKSTTTQNINEIDKSSNR